MGAFMRLALNETLPLKTVQYSESATDTSQSLMTPTRRAALDALEREFHELLIRGAAASPAR